MHATLDQVRADVANRLAEGAGNRRSALHTPVVGTRDGAMRVMVLRDFDAPRWRLRFHTDARSPKVGAIGAGAPVQLLFYDPAAKVQIRASGHGRIERSGPVADLAWGDATNFAKRCYLAQAAPGATADGPTSGLPAAVEGIMPGDEELVPARANFAVLLVDIERVDWLYLAQEGHRRAQFEIGGEGRWVVP